MTKADLDGDHVFAVHDFLSPAECAEFIRMSRGLSWEVGTVGGEEVESVRNNERVLFDHPVLAADLFARARPFLPAAIGRRPLVGFNERWRFYRYGPGQAFRPHRDGSYARVESGDESHLTFMVYLNDVAAGGETRFFAGMEDAFERRPYLTVAPRAGTALVFIHRIWHEGAAVTAGEKFVLRTDIMYGLPAGS
jgi:prolyl 4-hydroxylase